MTTLNRIFALALLAMALSPISATVPVSANNGVDSETICTDLFASPVASPTDGGHDGHHSDAPVAAEVPLDLAFLDHMIPHHEAAVVAAQILLARSSNPELLEFANGIIEVQTAEIEEMQGYRDAWFPAAPATPSDVATEVLTAAGSDVTDAGHAQEDTAAATPGADSAHDVSALCTVEDVDRAFLEGMITHHNDAVVIAAVIMEKGEHDEIRDLAMRIVTTQGVEIEQMATWLATMP